MTDVAYTAVATATGEIRNGGRAAARNQLDDLAVIVEITLHHEYDDFWLSAVPHLEVSGIDQRTAEELGDAAHQICPYSKANRGNIEVTIDATVG